MSTLPIPDLLYLWGKDKLSVEQVRPRGTRHLLQHLLALHQRLSDLEKRLRQLEQSIKPQR